MTTSHEMIFSLTQITRITRICFLVNAMKQITQITHCSARVSSGVYTFGAADKQGRSDLLLCNP